MKIQRFNGQDVQEALRLAQQGLGPEAVILQTRRVPATGLQKLIGRPRVEVLAAVDLPEGAAGTVSGSQSGARGAWMVNEGVMPPPSLRRAPRTDQNGSGPLPSGGAPSSASRGLEPRETRPEAWLPEPRGGPHGGASADWMNELAALRNELANLRLQLQYAQCHARPEGDPGGERSQSLKELSDRLVSGVETRTIEIREGSCTTVALVGPTGVGKTTTIAKLAAAATRVERRRVALITMDTYRIGAVEQLETYARLLDVPLSIAYSAEEMQAARDRYAGFDLVFVDTVGRPPGASEQLAEMANVLALALPDEVHLALDARGSYATHQSVLQGFAQLRPTHLLLSKLDEAPRLEDSLAAVVEGGLPISYVTTGQRVPEDLAAADREQLAGWLSGGQ